MKKINWAYVFSFSALVVSIIVLIKDCGQNQSIKSLTYSVNAIEYNPRISIVDTPYIKSMSIKPPKELLNLSPIFYVDNHLLFDTSIVKVNSDSLEKGKLMALFKSEAIMDSILEYYAHKKEHGDTLELSLDEVNYTINTEIIIKNIGNSLASILLHCTIDTVSGEPILRNEFSRLVSGQKSGFNFKQKYMDEFFQDELTPNKSLTIPISLQVYKINKENKINLHFFIMYENEMGTIYDTYFWVVYENAPMGMEPIYSFHEPTNQVYLKFKFHDDVKSRFKVSTSKVSYNIYDEDNSEEIKKWMEDNQPPKQQNN